MQIIGDIAQLEEAALHLRQAPGKEVGVVGLEMDLAAELQDLLVFFQEGVVGQAALGVLLARPGVAEVDVEQVDLIVGEKLVDVRRVERDEEDVFEALADRGLHREHQRVLHALDGDEQDIGFGLRGLDGELALAAADLDAQLTAAGHEAAPTAAQRLRLVDPDGLAGLHPGREVVSSSHSHGGFPALSDNWFYYIMDPAKLQRAIAPHRQNAQPADADCAFSPVFICSSPPRCGARRRWR